MAGLPSRLAARELLAAVLERRRTLDDAVDEANSFARLEGRDRAFARLIAATCLRRLGQIDAVIGRLLERPLPPRGALARDALRVGAAQLLFLDTPAHAAVGTAVAFLTGRQAVFRGMVNAVLRRIARERADLLADGGPLDNIPAWLAESWRASFGAETTASIAGALMRDPPLDLTLRDGDPAEWATRLDARVLPTGTLRRAIGGAPDQLPGFADGAWWVQDAAASLPARLLGPVAGRPVFDLCAAPGGKTAQLAAAGARVTAVERGAKRMRRLAQNLQRLKLTAELVEADVLAWTPPAPAPAVLLDAPCTATGTARRNPDVLHLKTAEDVARLLPLQGRLLDAAARATARDGVLVYCVCSLQPEEGPMQVDAFLGRTEHFARRPIAAEEIGGLATCIDARGDLRTLPCHLDADGGLDGFYAARLVRTA
ncbi:MAG: MFS transporter [Alphaproteobacteria bacterium]|nr:MFS transporter [Alphaproteobacteria bacterium]